MFYENSEGNRTLLIHDLSRVNFMLLGFQRKPRTGGSTSDCFIFCFAFLFLRCLYCAFTREWELNKETDRTEDSFRRLQNSRQRHHDALFLLYDWSEAWLWLLIIWLKNSVIQIWPCLKELTSLTLFSGARLDLFILKPFSMDCRVNGFQPSRWVFLLKAPHWVFLY